METDEKPFDDRPRTELHRAHAGDDRRIQISQLVGSGNGDHTHMPLCGAGTASSSRSITFSVSTPSDSA